MKIAVAQINPTVGAFAENAALICDHIAAARDGGADGIVFPELALCGYPPRDLLLEPSFLEAHAQALSVVQDATQGILAIVGGVQRNEGLGPPLYNVAFCLRNQQLLAVQAKTLLPNYDVFDEQRYFAPAESWQVLELAGSRVGICICEDAWYTERYAVDPLAQLRDAHIDLLINLSASPYSYGKRALRDDQFTAAAKRVGCPVIMCNQVGANDQLIFDGSSAVYTPEQGCVWRGESFTEQCVILDVQELPTAPVATPDAEMHEVYEALILGIRDYFRKCGFNKALIGSSGGIDSAVTAVLATEALGATQVECLAMPSPFSAGESARDARLLAERLGTAFREIPIHEMYQSFRQHCGSGQADNQPDLAEENLQARIRGAILMTESNRSGALVLTTGNKSELAVGYCTLYGDMNGGLSVLADVPKTMVYALARWINRNEEVIPAYIIERPPSAELRPEQRDDDSLPPYDVLDAIIQMHVEENKDREVIVDAGIDAADVERVLQLIRRNEYKRAQAAPGLKVTSKAFGVGRRYPIAHGWKGRS